MTILYFASNFAKAKPSKHITTMFKHERSILFSDNAIFHVRVNDVSFMNLTIDEIEEFLQYNICVKSETNKKTCGNKNKKKMVHKTIENMFSKKPAKPQLLSENRIQMKKHRSMQIVRLCFQNRENFDTFVSLLFKFNLKNLYFYMRDTVHIDIQRDLSALLLHETKQEFSETLNALRIMDHQNQSVVQNMETVVTSATKYFPVISKFLQMEKSVKKIKNSNSSVLTLEQQNVMDEIVKLKNDIMVLAAPGAGKTYTLLNCFKEIHSRGEKIIVIAYNKALIASLDNEYKTVDPNSKRIMSKMEHSMTKTFDGLARQIWVNLLCRNPNLPDGNGAYCKAIKDSKVSLAGVNFNYSVLFIDEIQDLNENHVYLLKIIKQKCPEIKIISFGDFRQCLYAEKSCVEDILAFTNWQQLKISTSYRCNRTICEFANTVFKTTDWTNVDVKWNNKYHLFEDEMLSVEKNIGILTPTMPTLEYKLIEERRISLSTEFVSVVEKHIKSKLSENPTATIFILTPALNNGKSKILIDALANKLMQTFGAFSTIIRKSNSEHAAKHVQRSIEIMTVHGSKGLTCDHVILLHCFSTNLKYAFQNYELNSNIKFFVAVTRARSSVLFVDLKIENHTTGLALLQNPNVYGENKRLVEFLESKGCDKTQAIGATKLIENISHDSKLWQPKWWAKQSLSTRAVLADFDPKENVGKFTHPFLSESLLFMNNTEIWSTYGCFMENVLNILYFKENLKIPLFVTNQENENSISKKVCRRFYDLTGANFDYQKNPIYALTCMKDVEDKNATIQKYLHTADGSLGWVWNMTRAVMNLNSVNHEMYEKKSQEIMPKNDEKNDKKVEFSTWYIENFSDVMEHLKSTISDFIEVKCQFSLLPCFVQNDAIEFNLLGVCDVVIFGACEAIIIDIKCYSDERRFLQRSDAGYEQLAIYSHMLKEQFENIKNVRCVLFSCFTGKIYEIKNNNNNNNNKRKFENIEDEEEFEYYLQQQQQEEEEQY
jgi:hypothetical protein